MQTTTTAADVPPLLLGNVIIRRARPQDVQFAQAITTEMEDSARKRGTGIAKRPPETIIAKILAGKCVVAVTTQGEWAGFAYLETWENEKFVSNSGLIVAPAFREQGIAAAIKKQVFLLSRRLYPQARICSITTSAAVMKLNSRLGFEPVSFAQITHDPAFWEGCKSCVNHAILCAKQHQHCLCTALLFEPEQPLR